MPNWFPKRGELVFSTPVDVSLNHLTRLEEVVVTDRYVITASGRMFNSNLVSIDDTSLEYGVLELREKTSERMLEFQKLRSLEGTEMFLRSLDWEKFVNDLDAGGIVLLHGAVQKIKNQAAFKNPFETPKDNRPVAWLYFRGSKPKWVPPFTDHLIETVDGEYLAELGDGSLHPVPQPAVRVLLHHGMMDYLREPLTVETKIT